MRWKGEMRDTDSDERPDRRRTGRRPSRKAASGQESLDSRATFNIHGHAAVLLDYQWQREGRDLMLRQVFIERRPAVLITTLTTTPADLPHHEPAWKQAMQTLVPRSTPS